MGEEQTVVPAGSEPETQLVHRILAGDRSAEDQFVSAYRRGIFVIAMARTRDREAALDLTQEILIAVLTALRKGQLRESAKLPAFIQGTARNLINNYLRTRIRRSECDLEGVEEIACADPIEALESAERQRQVRQELSAFRIADQQILLLSLVDGHTLAEVAQRLDLSHDAVRARKSRMLRKIQKKFEHLSQKGSMGPLNH
jgi:RNA polymerase sigma factor (sigma-70 family)